MAERRGKPYASGEVSGVTLSYPLDLGAAIEDLKDVHRTAERCGRKIKRVTVRIEFK